MSSAVLLALTTLNCQVSRESTAGRQPTSCQQKRAFWEAEFAKMTPGPAAARIHAIEAIADRIGEDPERCAAEAVRKALERERARLVSLRIRGSTVPAAAVYTCTTLSKELRCISSVADDTAHLHETSSAAVVTLAGGGEAKLEVDTYFAQAKIRVYVAGLSSLVDAPKYTELALDDTGGVRVPIFSEQIVLFVIVSEPGTGIYNKFVWLAKTTME